MLDIRNEMRRIRSSEPTTSTSRVETIESMEDFHREENRLSDDEAFNTLVGFKSPELTNIRRWNATLFYFLTVVYVTVFMYLFQQVLQLSRIGGRNVRDCVHKVIDRCVKHETYFNPCVMFVSCDFSISDQLFGVRLCTCCSLQVLFGVEWLIGDHSGMLRIRNIWKHGI